MAESTFNIRLREVVRGLCTLVADRSRRETELTTIGRTQTALIDREHLASVETAEKDHERERASLIAEYETTIAQARDRIRETLTATRRAMKAEADAFNEKTGAIKLAAKQKLEEAAWLAETLVEAGESKAKLDHQRLVKAVEHKLSEIEKLHEAADALLRQHGFDSIMVSDGAVSSQTNGVLTTAELDAAFARVVRDFDTLRARTESVLAQWPLAMIVSLIAGAGGVTAAWFLKVQGTMNLAALAGGAALVAGTVMLVLRTVSRREVPVAAKAVLESIEHSRVLGAALISQAGTDRDSALSLLHIRRDSEVRRTQEQYEAFRKQLDQRNNLEGPELRAQHVRALQELESSGNDEIEAIGSRHSRMLQLAGEKRIAAIADADSRRERRLRELDATLASDRAKLETDWSEGLARARAESASLNHISDQLSTPWSADGWDQFSAASTVPSIVRFGSLAVDISTLPGGLPSDARMRGSMLEKLQLPATLDLQEKASLFLLSPPEARAQSISILQNVMLRLLATCPPGKVRFTIIDPVGLGQNFAGFMHLTDYEPQIVSDKIWTDPRHIEQKLTDLTEHMETVIQKYLRNEYKTIQEYNEQAGEVAEPYRFLVIADFPANLSEAAAKKLSSIVTSGARCGVFTLIAADTKTKPPPHAPVADVQRSSITLAWKEGRFVWSDEDFAHWPLTLDTPPGEERMSTILHRIGHHVKDSSRVQVPFEAVTPPPSEMWSLSASSDIRVPLGRAGAKKLQYLTMGRGTAQHALIAGRTGSGKSTLLHVIITSMSLWYSPDEVELYLVDFKKGVEFKTYATHRLPHARVVAVESEREFGVSVLKRLDAELTRRGQLFREAGVQDVASYRAHAARSGKAHRLPRILFLVDEFQEFFVEDDKLSQDSALLLDRLVRQGRAFGIHVILGSQTLGGAFSIARSTIGQMAIRIALQSSESDAYLIMSEDNAAPRLLSRPGEAIYNDASGMVEGNSPFQVVWLPDDKRETYLKRLTSLVQEAAVSPPTPPIVFEGNIPADLSRNHLLMSLLGGQSHPPTTAAAPAWLGDPVSIKEPTSALFRRQSGGNLLIVGQQEDAAMAIFVASAISLDAYHKAAMAHAHHNGTPSARFVFLDASPPDAPESGVLPRLAPYLTCPSTICSPRECSRVLAELNEELSKRESDNGSASTTPIYVFIHGLQRFRDLRKGDEFEFSVGDKPQTTSQVFQRLLREGAAHGIHVLAWCDAVTNLDRCLDRRGLREFESRVLFQMSASDSTHLIDGPQASGLGRYRAILYREDLGHIEKFRPYAMPQIEQIFAHRSHGRAASMLT